MKLRKQVYDLTLSDLQASPVWEFALDEEGEEGQDEATVRPFEGPLPVDPGHGMFVVRARFRLADGTHLSGYLSPPVQGDNSVAAVQPIIVMADGQVMFWYGAFAPTPDAVKAAYRKLGRTPSQIFPVAYESEVPVQGGPVQGELNGFAHLRSPGDDTVVELR